MKNISPLLTLGLMTCGRPNMVYLTLRRMKNFPCRILIADGSLEPLDSKYFPSNVEYFHIPDSNFAVRLQAIVDAVQTPYFAFMAERRTVSWSSYQKCLTFLEDNADYSCAVGKIVYAAPEGVIPLYVFNGGLDGYRQQNPLQRMHASYTHYQPLFYGVVRTDIFKSHLISPPLWRLSEIYVQNRILIEGKAAILPCIYEYILPSPPRVAKTLDDPMLGHLLFPHFHGILLPLLAKKMQCAEEEITQYLHDVLGLATMSWACQNRVRSNESSTTLEMFLEECDADAPGVILDMLDFCSANAELYNKALSTLTKEGPNSAQLEEELLLQQAYRKGVPFDYTSPWFTPEEFAEKVKHL